MSRFNTNTNYPLIPNSNEYMIEQKVVSIHSEDRDIIKWPNSSEFEIELPSDYLRVSTVKLGTYTFPSNYNTFSLLQSNIGMTFRIINPYNPADYEYFDPVQNAIFNALEAQATNFIVFISEGFYTPIQMATELTNRMNDVVNNAVLIYLKNDLSLTQQFLDQGGYNQFVVVYNQVTQTLWFGNKSSPFILTNDSIFYNLKSDIIGQQCRNYQYPSFDSWGLPSYLGFTRCPTPSTTNSVPTDYPRFFYGDAVVSGDNGFWLQPDSTYKNKFVHYLEPPAKINLMGEAYFYMEIAGMNNIDETMPFAIDNFTSTSNMTLGVHNSAFAKIGVTTTPVSQWFDSNDEAVKIYNPPAERIKRIKVKIRYHNGQLVNFGKFNYSFNLIFNCLTPQNLRSNTTFDPTSGNVIGTAGFSKKF